MRLRAFLGKRSHSADVFLVPFAIPIAALFLIDSNNFILGWNEGAGGGLVFAFVFLTMEWYDARRSLDFRLDARKLLGIAASVSIIVAYFVAVYAFGQTSLVAKFGAKFGYISTPQILSWTRMWDYIIYALFILSVVAFSFGVFKIKYFSTPLVFLSGMAFILLLDATFPYGSMESLQVLMQPILAATVFLLRAVGVRVDLVGFDSLAVWGHKGFLFINMYWQCAGILSMTIYLLVIIILMVKLDTTVTRKLVFATLGAIGTFLVNIIRIFLIIYYGAFIDVNLKMFHESIGEVLFTVWIVIYLLTITAIEIRSTRNAPHLDKIPLSA
jgi:thaumarchaeosortase